MPIFHAYPIGLGNKVQTPTPRNPQLVLTWTSPPTPPTWGSSSRTRSISMVQAGSSTVSESHTCRGNTQSAHFDLRPVPTHQATHCLRDITPFHIIHFQPLVKKSMPNRCEMNNKGKEGKGEFRYQG